MELADALRLAFQITIALTVFATGLATASRELGYLLRRPGLLFRTLIATTLIAPIVALVLWRLLPIGPAAAIAILAGALAPGLPTVPRTLGRIGANRRFATSAMAINTALGVVTIPLWLAVLGQVAGIEIAVPELAIARLLVVGLLAPLLAGVAIRRLVPRLAARAAGSLGALASALTPGLVLLAVLLGASALGGLRPAALFAMVTAPVLGLAIGHALGGPRPRDRTALAIANATRFPALAVVIATTSFPAIPALPEVISYAVIASAITLPYALVRKRMHGPRAERAERPAPHVAPA